MPDPEIPADWPGDDASGLEDIPPGSHLALRSGLIIAAAIALALYLSFLLTGGGAQLFEPKVLLHTYMPDASGLAKKSPVRLNGVLVGKISGVGLTTSHNPKRVAVVDMAIQQRYLHQIPSDSIAALSADNLLGDQYIDIQAGRSATPVPPGGEVASLDQTAFNSADLVTSLKAVLQRVDYLFTQIERGDTRLGRFFYDETFYNSLREQITGIQEAIRALHTPSTPAGQMFFTDELYRRLKDPVSALDKTLEAMQRGEGPAGQMLANSQQYDDAEKNLRQIRQSLENFNKAPLLRDESLYNNSVALARSWSAAMDAASNGKGPLGPLLAKRELYDALNQTSGKVRFLVGDFRKNPRKYLRIQVF